MAFVLWVEKSGVLCIIGRYSIYAQVLKLVDKHP